MNSNHTPFFFAAANLPPPAAFGFPGTNEQPQGSSSPLGFPPLHDPLRSDLSIVVPKMLSPDTLLGLPEEDPDELFEFRFLCRCGILVLVGPSGIGKSTWITALAVACANGMRWHGFRPKKALRVLVVQAENDQHDLREMVLCAKNALGKDAPLKFENLSFVRENAATGARLCEIIRRLASSWRPDIVVLDPALAFIGGDSSSQAHVSEFLRNFLQPVLDEMRMAAVVVHHTTKGVQLGAKTMTRSDAYAGAGSAEWTNAARAVVTLHPTQIPGLIEVHAAKRGTRLRWETGGRPTTRTYIRQGAAPGEGWAEVSEVEYQALVNAQVDELLLKHLQAGEQSLTQLRAMGAGMDIPEHLVSERLNHLKASRRVQCSQNGKGTTYSLTG